jgi:hypothetical protein
MSELYDRFLPALLAWSTLWLAASTIGLWLTNERGFWRSLWFMGGLWATINVAIGVVSLVNPPADAEEFRRLLLINAGLDVGYLVVGALLLTRKRAMLRGFGVAILTHGLFLLVFDLIWWRLLAP